MSVKYVEFKKFTDENGACPIYLFEGEEVYFREKGEQLLRSLYVQEPTLDYVSFDGGALKGEKLKALHIADNHGQLDDHLMPFNGGEIDFTEVVKSLKEIGYQGLFNLEIPGERRIPLQLRDAKLQYVKAAYAYLMSL